MLNIQSQATQNEEALFKAAKTDEEREALLNQFIETRQKAMFASWDNYRKAVWENGLVVELPSGQTTKLQATYENKAGA